MENSFICGAFAGLITCTCVQPLDVVKTNIITLHRTSSTFDSISYIKQKYGMVGFWRGLRAASYKALIGSGMSFYYLETFKSLIPSTSTGFISNTIIAMVSRGLTIISLAPLSIVKVRMEAPQAIAYTSVGSALLQIYKEEGIKGYYRGMPSCLLRDLPFSGLAYSFYQKISTIFAIAFNNDIPTSANKLFAGASAGLIATILTQPFDIIKTRQQFSHISGIDTHNYKGIFDAIYKIFLTEGIKGFTIGLKIRLIERSSGFTIVWFLYENFKFLFK